MMELHSENKKSQTIPEKPAELKVVKQKEIDT